jgi:hypothetical protein
MGGFHSKRGKEIHRSHVRDISMKANKKRIYSVRVMIGDCRLLRTSVAEVRNLLEERFHFLI